MRTPPNERLNADIANTVPSPGSGEGEVLPAGNDGPERRCILTGDVRPRAELMRLVRAESGLVLPDLQARAPGRGAWIGVDRAGLQEALEKGRLKGALARAFKTGELDIPHDLADRIETGLVRLFLDRLGLEKRAGALISGSHALNEAARGGALFALMHASDASEDGRRKLDQAWRVGSDREGSQLRGTVLPLDREALSVALGRANVVHLGITQRGSAQRVEGVLNRLVRFTGASRADDGTATQLPPSGDTNIRPERDAKRALDETDI